jgi:replicative DNA helicase
MNELITAALDREEVQILNDFPELLMNDFETEITLWVSEYSRKYAQLPTLERLEKNFPSFVPIDSPDPIGDIFDREVLEKKRLAATNLVAEMTEKMRKFEAYDPTEDVSMVARSLNVSESGIIRYSTFDREKYFEPRVPVQFGFPLIDRVTGGLLNGDLCYIVGRLGTGKSTTAQWCTHNWWMDGKRMLFISNEMMPIDVLIRLDAMAGKFDPLKLRLSTRTIELEKKVRVVSHMAASAEGEIIFPRKRLITPSAVMAVAIQMEVDLIVIDGVYLMRPERHVNSKWERVAEVSNALKQGALELGIPVLGISQIRRLGSKDRPDIEDIAYSDALGQDADLVLSIVPHEDKDKVMLELIKNRFGDATIGTTLFIDWKTMTLIDETARPM